MQVADRLFRPHNRLAEADEGEVEPQLATTKKVKDESMAEVAQSTELPGPGPGGSRSRRPQPGPQCHAVVASAVTP